MNTNEYPKKKGIKAFFCQSLFFVLKPTAKQSEKTRSKTTWRQMLLQLSAHTSVPPFPREV